MSNPLHKRQNSNKVSNLGKDDDLEDDEFGPGWTEVPFREKVYYLPPKAPVTGVTFRSYGKSGLYDSGRLGARLSRDEEKASRALMKLGKNASADTKASQRVLRKTRLQQEVMARKYDQEPLKVEVPKLSRKEAFPIVEDWIPGVDEFEDTKYVDVAKSGLEVLEPEIEITEETEPIGFVFESEDVSEKESRRIVHDALEQKKNERKSKGDFRSIEKEIARLASKHSKLQRKDSIQVARSKGDHDLLVMKYLVEARLAKEYTTAQSQISKKTDRAILTGSAETLLRPGSKVWVTAHRKEIKAMIANAHIWKQNMSWHGYAPPRLEVGNYLPADTAMMTTLGPFTGYEELSFIISCVPDVRKHAEMNQIYRQWDLIRQNGSSKEVDRLRARFYDLTKGARLPRAFFQGQVQSAPVAEDVPAPVPPPRNKVTFKAWDAIPITVDITDTLHNLFPSMDEMVEMVGEHQLESIKKGSINIFLAIQSLWQNPTFSNLLTIMGFLMNNHDLLPKIGWVAKHMAYLIKKLYTLIVSYCAEHLPDGEFIRARFQGHGSDSNDEESGNPFDFISEKVTEDWNQFSSHVSRQLKTTERAAVDSANQGIAKIEESFLKTTLFFTDFATVMKSSQLIACVWDFMSCFSVFASMASLGVLGDAETAFKWKERIEKLLAPKIGIDSVVKKFVLLFKTVLTSLAQAIRQRDWTILFSNKTPEDWVDCAYCLLEDESIHLDRGRDKVMDIFQKRKNEGKIPARIVSPLTPTERGEMMDMLIEESADHLKRFQEAGSVTQCITIRELVSRMRSESFKLANAIVNGQLRKQPFSVYMYGCPGSSKSTFQVILHDAFANILDLPKGPESRYTLVADSNFYDGYHDQWYCMFDDIDASLAKPVAGARHHVKHVMDLINVKATEMEQADVTEKGKKFANFLAATYSSNYEFGRLQGYTLEPRAFWRRFNYYVTIEVRKPFGTAQGALKEGEELQRAIALDKQMTGVDHTNDYWIFKVDKRDDTRYMANNPYLTKPFARKATITSKVEFCKLMAEEFKYHIAQQTKTLTLLDVVGPVCPYCHLSQSNHPSGTMCEVKLATFQMLMHLPESDRKRTIVLLAAFMISVYFNAWWLWVVLIGWYYMHPSHFEFMWPIIQKEVEFQYWRSQQHPLRWMHNIRNKVAMMDATEFRASIPAFQERYAQTAFARVDWKVFGAAIGTTGIGIICLYKYLEKFEEDNREKALKEFHDSYQTIIKTLPIKDATLTRPLVWHDVEEIYKDHRTLFQAYVTEEQAKAPFDFANKEVKFVRVPIEREKFIPTGTTVGVQDVVKYASSQTYQIQRVSGGKVWDMYCTHYEGFFYLVPKHFFTETRNAHDEDFHSRELTGEMLVEIRPKGNGSWTQFSVTFGGNRPTGMEIPGRDLVLFWCPMIVPIQQGIKKYVPLTSCASVTQSFDEVYVDKGGVVSKGTGKYMWPHIRRGSHRSIKYDGIEMKNGDCGIPVVVKSSTWVFIAALHHAVMEFLGSPNWYMGEELVQSEINVIEDQLVLILEPYHVKGVSFQSRQSSLDVEDVKLVPLPPKSSLWAALSRNKAPALQVLGTISPGRPLMGLKSQCYETRLKPYFDEWFREISPDPVSEYCIPSFKGEMTAEGWVDPYTVNLEAMRNKNGNFEAWEWAYKDYVLGMEDLAGWDQIRPLSDYETFVGIEETSVKSVNLKTSAGAPFFTRKKNLMKIDREKEEVSINPTLMSYVDDILETIKRDEVYSPLCWHTLKDEAISQKKNLMHKIRVFNTLPFAYNFLLKKYLSPLALFMRQHRAFFESAVGMNICSRDLDVMILEMETRGKEGWTGDDYEWYDIRQCTIERLFVAMVWLRCAQCANYTPEECKIVYFLSLGTIFTTRCIKNDLFLMAFTNPSGSLMTADDNSVGNSLTFRYPFRRAQQDGIIPEGPFRPRVALRTLGDDNAKNVRKDIAVWDTAMIAKYMVEVGHVLTDAKKSGIVSQAGTVESISFLKRSFVKRLTRIGEVWFAPIELKSIMKMVSVAVFSELSEKDHIAVLLSNGLRESFLHGEEIFTRFLRIAEVAGNELDLLGNEFFQMRTFSYFEEEYLAGNFITNVL